MENKTEVGASKASEASDFQLQQYSLGFSFKKVPEVLDYEFISVNFPAWKSYKKKPNFIDILETLEGELYKAKLRHIDSLMGLLYE